MVGMIDKSILSFILLDYKTFRFKLKQSHYVNLLPTHDINL